MNFDNIHDTKSNTPKACNETNYCDTYFLIYTDDQGLHQPFAARFYCTRTGTVHCRVWLHLEDTWAYGIGWARGYGYDKMSAALSSALKDAGVVCDESERFSGTGMSHAMSVIQRALESKLGITLYPIHSFA